ncbi:hypothetical protein V8B55DRAFT_1590550 [Mucor lusitanicus]|uniref:Nucleoplasmin-like domain-containing protein n=1 Tax=Mucor circinelloides f. lusitanicus TaxID=29924 RepID=A0A8H4BCM5_MUCCL|nr:hypothetical protein FB192DRAFT_1139826 [Mucor lusitanicus]
MLVRGLWGIQIGPQSDQIIKVEASFRITMASIFEFNGPERTSVYVRFHDSTFLLCSLIPEKIEQQVVDITCLQGEEIMLRVDGPNVIHLLGNYISQDGIDDQQDDEIGFLEVNGSDADEPGDVKLEETTPSVIFPAERKGLGFDESDEFDSSSEAGSQSEAESESEAMPFYSVAQLGSYADRLPSTTPTLETSKGVENRAAPVSNAEGAGRYVLLNGSASVRSSTEETEPFDQQAKVADQTPLAELNQHTTETEKRDNANMDSQATKVVIDIESSPEHDSDQEPQHDSDLESKLESEQASEQVSDYEPELESEQVSENEVQQESQQKPDAEPAPKSQQGRKQERKAEQVSKPGLTLKSVAEPIPVPTPEATQQPIQQTTPKPAMKPTSKPDQSTIVDKTAAISKKQKKPKKKPDSIPLNTPSPIKKKDKAAKKQEQKIKAALAKQQEAKGDSSKDAEKQKKAQQNKIKAKKISKKKQALASKNESSPQHKSTEGPSQDIKSLLMGAFASMATALQSAATAKPKPSPAPKFKKRKDEEIEQDGIPPVVASNAVKPKKPRKPKVPAAPVLSQQNDQTQSPDANGLGTSTQPEKKKKPAKKPNVTQEDASTAAPVLSQQNDQTQSPDANGLGTSTQPKKKKKPNVTQENASTAAPPVGIDPPAVAPAPIAIPTVSPVPISVPSSARSSPAPGDESPRVRYPRKAVDIDSMQKLALFAQEDAKSADALRKERKKKKKSQRPDEAVAKKARLSIE